MNPDKDDKLTHAVIGAAIEVHRELGPGEDELAYEEALGLALHDAGIEHARQLPVRLRYKGQCLDCGFRLDLFVQRRLPVELKAVDDILPIHHAQALTYLRLCEQPLGLLLNFKVPALRCGIRRFVLSRAAPVARSSPLRCIGDATLDAIGQSAAEVHRNLGPGLLRSAYEECLCHELRARGLPFVRRHELPLFFKNRPLARRAEAPLLVANRVPVFCLSVQNIEATHVAHLLALMRRGGWRAGLLINFNVFAIGAGVNRLELR